MIATRGGRGHRVRNKGDIDITQKTPTQTSQAVAGNHDGRSEPGNLKRSRASPLLTDRSKSIRTMSQTTAPTSAPIPQAADNSEPLQTWGWCSLSPSNADLGPTAARTFRRM